MLASSIVDAGSTRIRVPAERSTGTRRATQGRRPGVRFRVRRHSDSGTKRLIPRRDRKEAVRGTLRRRNSEFVNTAGGSSGALGERICSIGFDVISPSSSIQ